MQRFVLTKELLPKIGSHSLQGLFYKAGLKPGPVTLVFQGSPNEYLLRHNGPEEIIIPDYMPFCLVESILAMQQEGWQFTVKLDCGD